MKPHTGGKLWGATISSLDLPREKNTSSYRSRDPKDNMFILMSFCHACDIYLPKLNFYTFRMGTYKTKLDKCNISGLMYLLMFIAYTTPYMQDELYFYILLTN